MGRGSAGGGGGGGRGGVGGNKHPGSIGGSGGSIEGVKFVRTPGQAATRYVLVRADVGKLDRSLASDKGGFHVGPGGAGGVPGRHAEAARFLGRARAEGIAVHAPRAGIDRAGRAYLGDGRHRFAAARDSGATAVPVAVPRGQAARFSRLFGP